MFQDKTPKLSSNSNEKISSNSSKRRMKFFIKNRVTLEIRPNSLTNKLRLMKKYQYFISKANFLKTDHPIETYVCLKLSQLKIRDRAFRNIFNFAILNDNLHQISLPILNHIPNAKLNRTITLCTKLSSNTQAFFKKIKRRLAKFSNVKATFLGSLPDLYSPNFKSSFLSLKRTKLASFKLVLFQYFSGSGKKDLTPFLQALRGFLFLRELSLNINHEMHLKDLDVFKSLAACTKLNLLKISTFLDKQQNSKKSNNFLAKTKNPFRNLKDLRFRLTSKNQEFLKYLLSSNQLQNIEIDIPQSSVIFSNDVDCLSTEIAKKMKQSRLRSLKLNFGNLMLNDTLKSSIDSLFKNLQNLKQLSLTTEVQGIFPLFTKIAVVVLKNLISLELKCKASKSEWEQFFAIEDQSSKNLENLTLHLNESISFQKLTNWFGKLTKLKALKLVFGHYQIINENELSLFITVLEKFQLLENLYLDLRDFQFDEKNNSKKQIKSQNIGQVLFRLQKLFQLTLYLPGGYLTDDILKSLIRAFQKLTNLYYIELGGSFVKVNQKGVILIDDYLSSPFADKLISLEIIPWRCEHLEDFHFLQIIEDFKNRLYSHI